MRVPINWLKDYVKPPKDLNSLTDKLTMAGHLLDKIEKNAKDTIIDLELRGNRADCYSILGIAKEVSAIFNTPVNYPKIHSKLKKTTQLPSCKNSINTSFVKRAMMVEITNITLHPSPKWMVERLTAYGISTINNIVDLTNYVMLETGEPMHAFDRDKIGKNIEIRLAKNGEKMTTFLGETISLTKEDLVWANSSSPLSVAGAIGEKGHSVSLETKNIIVEAANYDRANIRRTIYRHKIFTDAGIRHEKELDPNLVEFAIYRFLQIIKENKWGTIKPYIFDYYPQPVKSWKITLNHDYIKKLGGTEIDKKRVIDILTRLGFKIIKNDAKKMTVLCPTERTDVRLPEDLIEEILRIYGYENIPTSTLAMEIPKNISPTYINQELNLKEILVSIGFDEAISSSFIKEDSQYLNFYPFKDVQTVAISNPPSPDVCKMRMTLLPNLTEFANKVVNERGDEARFFEIGKVYYKDKQNNYIEKRRLGLIYWEKDKDGYLKFKGLLESLFIKMHLPKINYVSEILNLNGSNMSYFITHGKEIVGFGTKIDNFYYTELDLDNLLGIDLKQRAQLWPKYPPQIEDLTFEIPERTRIGDFIVSIKSVSTLINKIELKDIYQDSYTFKVHYQDLTKTLSDSDVQKIRVKIEKIADEKFGAKIKN